MTDQSIAGQAPVDTIARVLDITPRRVQQLVDEGWIPRAAHGQYPLVGSIRGYVRYLKAGSSSLKDEQARLVAAKREIQELKAAKLKGELVPAAAVRTALQRLETRLKRGVDTEADLDALVAEAARQMGLEAAGISQLSRGSS